MLFRSNLLHEKMARHKGKLSIDAVNKYREEAEANLVMSQQNTSVPSAENLQKDINELVRFMDSAEYKSKSAERKKAYTNRIIELNQQKEKRTIIDQKLQDLRRTKGE